MNRILLASLIALSLACGAGAQRRGSRSSGRDSGEAPPLAKTETEKKILATLDSAVKAGELYANVPPADGRMLRILAETLNAKQVVEIGTSTGLSGLWISMALDKTGGKLMTFEIDPGRAATARKHFKEAGVEHLVQIVEGDAHQNIAKVKGPIDMVFLDAEKEGYIDYLNKLLPQVRAGGLILAHNTDMVADYLKHVAANPDLDTVIYATGGGMSVTLKKR